MSTATIDRPRRPRPLIDVPTGRLLQLYDARHALPPGLFGQVKLELLARAYLGDVPQGRDGGEQPTEPATAGQDGRPPIISLLDVLFLLDEAGVRDMASDGVNLWLYPGRDIRQVLLEQVRCYKRLLLTMARRLGRRSPSDHFGAHAVGDVLAV